MSQPASYDYTRYLAAKRIIDEQSFNLRVWEQFIEALNRQDGRARILEVGAGIGATAERILTAASHTSVHYTLVDRSPENITRAQNSLRRWARDTGYTCHDSADVLYAQRSGQRLRLQFVTADVFDFAEATEQKWDVLVAQAFLDLVNLQETFARLGKLLLPPALLYLPIHFDGLTVFEPIEMPSVHHRVLQAYHDTMDERDTAHGLSGGSRTGRTLISTVQRLGTKLLSVGSSDWVVVANEDGFSNAEKYFLYHLLHFVEASVQNHPAVTQTELQQWLQHRRRQIEEGTLIFIAHQIDLLAQRPLTESETS